MPFIVNFDNLVDLVDLADLDDQDGLSNLGASGLLKIARPACLHRDGHKIWMLKKPTMRYLKALI